jgi:hypothetical protein
MKSQELLTNSDPPGSCSKMSSDFSPGKPIAMWNAVRGVWETGQMQLFCEHSELYSETLPREGTMRNGRLYERPTSGHRIEGKESSSGLLPTPTAILNAPAPWKPGVDWWLQSRATRNLEGVVTGNTPLMGTPTSRDYKGVPGKNVQLASLPRDISLLPTPNATDRKGSNVPAGRERWNRTHPIERHDGDGNLPAIVALLPTPNADESHHASRGASLRRASKRQSEGRQLSVEEAVILLPTPNTMDSLPPKTQAQIQAHRDQGRGGDSNLREYVLYELPPPAAEVLAHVESEWGRYEPAIRRWETMMGRPAPEPTEAGKDGKPRLSPAFTEFLMGLPEGWVCGTGISRKGQLHALGNGVVSLQAELALRILLERQQQGGSNGF